MCNPGCPGTHFVDQAGPEIRGALASASPSLALKGAGHPAQLGFQQTSLAFLRSLCLLAVIYHGMAQHEGPRQIPVFSSMPSQTAEPGAK